MSFAEIGSNSFRDSSYTPLVQFETLSSKEAVTNYLCAHISKSPSSTEEKTQEFVQKILKYTIFLVAFGRALTFVPLSLKIPVMGPVCAGCNILVSTASDSFFGSSMVDGLFGYRTPEEKLLTSQGTSKCYQGALVLSCFFGALASQITSIYTTWLYNSLELRIPSTLINALGGTLYPMYSMWLLEQKKLREQGATEGRVDKQFLKMQEELVKLIQEKEKVFRSKPIEEKNALIQNFNQARDLEGDGQIEAYFRSLLSIEALSNTEVSQESKIATYSLKTLSLILAVTYLWAKGEFTWVETENIVTDNIGVAVVFTALYEGVTAYGTYKLIESSTSSIFQSIRDRNVPILQKSLAEQFRQKDISALRLSSYAVTFFALGVTYVIWNDFYKNEIEKDCFIAAMSVAVFFIFSATNLKIIQSFVEGRISSHGTEEEKQIMSLSSELQKLAKFAAEVSPKNLEDFFSIIPDEINGVLTKRISTPTAPLILSSVENQV